MISAGRSTLDLLPQKKSKYRKQTYTCTRVCVCVYIYMKVNRAIYIYICIYYILHDSTSRLRGRLHALQMKLSGLDWSCGIRMSASHCLGPPQGTSVKDPNERVLKPAVQESWPLMLTQDS